MAEKAVVIYSGGMDSFTILNRAIKEGFEVYALTFDYGQKHKKEIDGWRAERFELRRQLDEALRSLYF